MRHRIRLAPAKTPHVAEKRALLAPSQLAPADLVPRGALQDRLIDVRDVLGITHALATGLEQACQHVEDDERARSEEHTSELQSHSDLVCRLLLEKKKKKRNKQEHNTHDMSE